jgi:peptidylprolyl isomerase
VRRVVAGLVVTPLLLLTAACGGNNEATTVKAVPGTLADITVTGSPKAAPKVDFKAPLSFATTTSKVIDKGPGTGAAIQSDSVVTLDYVAINASDDDEFDSSYKAGKSATFGLSQVITGFGKGLAGDHAGDRVLVAVASKDGFDPVGNGTTVHKGDSLIFVIDVLKVANPLKVATGTKMSAPATVPTVTYDSKGVPTGFKATATTPKKVAKLGVYPIIKGKGPVVKTGQAIVVNYLGQIYPDGAIFDQSFDTDKPISSLVGEGKLIPGWDKAIVGQTVGSRLILVIPSALGYGKAGQGTTIPANSDLIFVVDILQAY